MNIELTRLEVPLSDDDKQWYSTVAPFFGVCRYHLVNAGTNHGDLNMVVMLRFPAELMDAEILKESEVKLYLMWTVIDSIPLVWIVTRLTHGEEQLYFRNMIDVTNDVEKLGLHQLGERESVKLQMLNEDMDLCFNAVIPWKCRADIETICHAVFPLTDNKTIDGETLDIMLDYFDAMNQI